MLGNQSGVLEEKLHEGEEWLIRFFFFWTLFPGVPQFGKHLFFMESMGRGAVV